MAKRFFVITCETEEGSKVLGMIDDTLYKSIGEVEDQMDDMYVLEKGIEVTEISQNYDVESIIGKHNMSNDSGSFEKITRKAKITDFE